MEFGWKQKWSIKEVCSGTCSCVLIVKFLQLSNILFRRKGYVSPKRLNKAVVQDKNRYRSASLTAEAAMVLPIFFFSIYILWQCFLLLLVQMSVCREVTEVTLAGASLGYVGRMAEKAEDLAHLYEPLVWTALADEERLTGLHVSFEETSNRRIQGKVAYVFCVKTVIFPEICLPVVQTFSFLPYIGEYDGGEKDEETEEEIVYVTAYGTVYHKSRTCSYLTVEVSRVSFSMLSEKRNIYGRKYGACSICAREGKWEQVYVSVSGEKYHSKADCPALKRMVQEKKREEVLLPACTRCGEEMAE
ncbi:MAG: hypothetical protein E7260_08545 [Lachnospiraceae bacterium]|nr:hypothetical protein [Lachnospiraceae bacterium]